MKKFKGTKGDWIARKGDKNKHGVQMIEIDSDYGVESLATVYAPSFDEVDPSEYQANAQLIAAAPQLLKVLQDILNRFNARSLSDAMVKSEAQAAIDKALTL